MREFLRQRGWRRLSKSGSETWVQPDTNVLFTLSAAYRVQRQPHA